MSEIKSRSSVCCRSNVSAANAHQPVLLARALAGLAVRADGRYVDATFGRGGHSAAILQELGPEGRLLALDRDWQAVESAPAQALAQDPRVRIQQACFDQLSAMVEELGWSETVAGVLFDLGVSSPQLDEPLRGFSFSHDAPLDMRMDNRQGLTAAEWLEQASEADLARCFWRYGEERFARRIARAVVERRRRQRIATTRELAQLVEQVLPFREAGKHPATRTFQALRILVNDELGTLERALPQALQALMEGGRLVVIAFHSLEDRIVKDFIRSASHTAQDPITGQPIGQANMRKIGGLVRPLPAEVAANPRARSAVMRIAEKLTRC